MSEEISETSPEPYSVLVRLPAPTLVADGEGRYLFANDAAAALLKRTRDEILGRTITDLVPQGFDFADAWSRFLKDGTQEGEIELQLPDGTLVPVHFSARRDFGPGIHISILTDLSQRRRVEANVRRTEELYSRAFNLSPAPTNVRRLSDGVFVDVNQAFTEAAGYWRSEVIGRTAPALGLWKEPQRLSAMLDELRGGEVESRTRAALVLKDRSVREFSVALRTADIFNEPHVIAVYTDMAAL